MRFMCLFLIDFFNRSLILLLNPKIITNINKYYFSSNINQFIGHQNNRLNISL